MLPTMPSTMRRVLANRISPSASSSLRRALMSTSLPGILPNRPSRGLLSSITVRYTQSSSTTTSSQRPQQRSVDHSNSSNDDGGAGGVAATAAEATTTAAAVSDASINAEELAKANFQKVRPSTLPLFPWRHSPLPLPRLDVTSDEFQRYGYLLGGDIRSSNPTADMYATAFLFMKASIFDIIFFKAFKSDLAESMSWAFSQGISSILSNVYSVPLQSVQKEGTDGSSNLTFEHGLGSEFAASDVDSDSVKKSSNENEDEDKSADGGPLFVDKDDLKEMVDDELLKLYESARDFGRKTMNVKLEMTTTPVDIQHPEIVNLFVFPFLSRSTLKEVPGFQHRYKRMVDAIAINDWTLARKELDDIMRRWVDRGWTESTVLAQVLVPCDEIFYVKDAFTGEVLQGHGDEKARRVVHLVRFEMVVKSHLKDDGSWIPVQNELGKWKITDIDDLLQGNQLL